ncbi:acetate and sugar kinases/Hsc70/actin family protein [Spirosoma pollinicola]|uniref:Uncharacterized protein n=1 Tax=Spirosoma pollinicola TaxID=2057025 RepID=A0A2K8Z823_9BACT|nr:hypothetical protein [Spirosoma pollinicola]AUD06008.1 hypothetical protein CWM47_31675 [Spirosoma pollinicola]
MPTKPLTLHNQTNGEDWFSRGTEYGKREIEGISDGVGGNTKQPPTSIPSPFARFDLVRTAFLRLSQNAQLRGEPNDERLVSECFDVSQLFFHFDKFRDQLEIIRWNREEDLEKLADSRSQGHKRFGKALNLFLDQDGGTAKTDNGYNFHKLKSLFILRYNGEKQSVVLGGTSTSTLFFSSPEDLSFIDDLQLGNYKLFTRNFCPLHRRNDPDFQKFWYGLLRRPNFSDYFPEVAAYLRKSLTLLQTEFNATWKEIGNEADLLAGEAYNKLFDDLITPDGGYRVEILDEYYVKKAKANESLLTNSDFVLHSDKFDRIYGPTAKKPMLLQHNYQGKLQYTRDLWNPAQEVSPYVEDNWRDNKRKLPGQADYYPYLTVSDFLEPYIIRLVYPINSEKFYDGGFSGNDITKSYLLPLTETFFDFFDVEDLYAGQGRKVSVDFQRLGSDSVKVTLTIPLKNNELPIKFERTYYGLDVSGNPQLAVEKENKGAIMECQFGVNLMPFVRVENSAFTPTYHIQVIDRDISYFTVGNDYQLRFIDRQNTSIALGPDQPRERSRKQQEDRKTATTKYYRLTKNFEYIVVQVNGKRGIIVPRFDKVRKSVGSEKFTFAVDFGTTNTHIEYKTINNPTPQAFTIGAADAPVATLHDPAFVGKDSSFNGSGADSLYKLVPIEWLPDRVGRPAPASFPTRTALLENQPNWSQNLYAFSDFNPALLYEKQNLSEPYHIETDLKWSNYKQDDHEEKRVRGYIESLLLMIRNKILLNGGNLAETKLVWFYPLSMLETRRVFFETLWNEQYQSTITDQNYPQRIPESTAPYYWFGNKVSSGTYPAVSIDIGGGTSDVVIFEDEKPTLITSFRFAANAIFGDAFAEEGDADSNGFVRRYEDDIRSKLKANNFTDLSNALESIRNRQRSVDIVAFFFSLKDNQEVQQRVQIDFNEMLAKDERFKVVFLIFYMALIYHVARIMKAKQQPMPRYIAFSGNGSKVLRILSTKPALLSQLARWVFEKVYETNYHEDGLDIVVEQKEPKEATCKGGLKLSSSLKFDREDDGTNDEVNDKIKAVLIGTTDDKFVVRMGAQKDTYQKINEDNTTLNSVAEEVRAFIELLFKVNDDISLKDKFGIRTGDLETYKRTLLRDMGERVKNGFKDKKSKSDVTDPIEETLFFYPLIKGLNTLASELAN